jgi:hypothetical protein
MADEPSPQQARLVKMVTEIVTAASHGDASDYPDLDLLTAIGAVWISRRLLADEPAHIGYLDQALQLLAAEVEARRILTNNPLRDQGPGGEP